MLRIHPFEAIRPVPEHAPRVASLPYDVVTTEEARALTKDNALSFLRVVRSEVDLPADTDPYSDEVYTTAKQNLTKLMDDGVLFRDDTPAVFLYRQVMNHEQQIGLVCCCHVEDYANDLIKKHEKTREKKENDRTRHVLELNANTGPVFLTYRQHDTIDRMVREDVNERPLYHFNAPDGVTHTVWQVSNPQRYVEAFRKEVPHAYVADGHHRAASAFRAGEKRKSENPEHSGDEEYNWLLSVLFPHDQLNILAYNRVVFDLGGKSADEVLEALREIGDVSETPDKQPHKPGSFCVYLSGSWYKLVLPQRSIDMTDPVELLDVALLQSRVLEPVLGIGDPRTDDRIDFIGGIHGPQRLEQLVDDGTAAIAFSLYPTSVQQLMAVADAGLIMPPKSTWFEPKLRSGLFVHALD